MPTFKTCPHDIRIEWEGGGERVGRGRGGERVGEGGREGRGGGGGRDDCYTYSNRYVQ